LNSPARRRRSQVEELWVEFGQCKRWV
jgi:hypothetical protein